MKTIDHKYLMTQPNNGATASVELKPRGAAGASSAAVVSVNGTYAELLAALDFLHEDGGATLIEAIMGSMLEDPDAALVGKGEDFAQRLQNRFHQEHVPARKLTTEFDLSTKKRTTGIRIDFTAVSAAAAVTDFIAATHPLELNQLAISLSPAYDLGQEAVGF
ncbi:hypothetical protein [Arthrobacter sp. A2-55]|uniref:hypothetical protein n=1 Tax=Arthrobacter sp. A2-55 TaxID=2897337 RepID=UPI0021CDBDD2|nr:hypothetical protein [Arthrobacter sp. A2-55]MCU6481300.1 hypothetical protein [Arthrobacter sp. A2-55]